MDNKNNFTLAIALSLLIILSWQHFIEQPKLAKMSKDHKIKQQLEIVDSKEEDFFEREKLIDLKDRIIISSAKVNGSISLKGARIDDLTLMSYKKDLSENSPNVNLLSPSGTNKSYFAEVGWYSTSYDNLPNANTLWKSNSAKLEPNNPIELTWVNSDQVKFIIRISLDENYMFTFDQEVINLGNKELILQPYGLINRHYVEEEKAINILHQGPIAVISKELKEYSFDNIKEKKRESFKNITANWLGISDKYWLVSFIPDSKLISDVNFSYAKKAKMDKYQVDFLSSEVKISKGEKFSCTNMLFSGAKKVDLLDNYASKYNITLFDRAIDFGWFYVLTKPMFHALNFFYKIFGNFGLSILFVTVCVKLLMFGMANKSYKSMQIMKDLQPEIEKLKESCKEDKNKFNQEIMKLYQRKKINPVSGCLPLLLQIPVFFSLYKVLYVTLEMRHAPFFLWIKDLSAPDPTSIFNIFGLLPFTPPNFLMIGIWPIMMSLTMYIQQKLSPPPADPVQAKVMSFMPLILLIMFSGFPAGLVIYWTWNNLLSIVQQKYIMAKNGK